MFSMSSVFLLLFYFFSKLFCKKIEEFVEGSHGISGGENASTLFRYCLIVLLLINEMTS